MNEEGNFCKIKTGASIDAADGFTPIALNEEILKKCGFNFLDYFKLWQKMQVLPKTGYLLEMDQDYDVRDFGHRYIGVRLKFLHQLQNLFFELKGIELDIEDFDVPKSEDDKKSVKNLLFPAPSKN